MVNPLTHCYFSLKLMKEHNLSDEELDHLIVGSILPDIHLSGLIQYHNTHTKSREFFEFTNQRLHKFTALGILLHAEKPFGIDHYTHKFEGFIHENSAAVKKIAKKYKGSIGKIDEMTIHFLIEYTIDYILSKRYPLIALKAAKALGNKRVGSAITAFSSFHEMSERKNKKIISIITSKHLRNFLKNANSLEGIAQNWLSVKFYRDLKESRKGTFKEKFKMLTKFSYMNLRGKISDKHLVNLFEELTNLLEDKTLKFLEEVEQKVKPLKDEYYSNI